MERLTKRDHDSLYYPHCFECCHGHPDADACLSCQFETTIIERLAAYEDTGLEPEEVERSKLTLIGKSLAEITEFDGVSIERLKELVRAEKAGRLVVLPFAPGTTLVDRSELERPALMKNFRLAVAYDHNGIVFHQPFGIFMENVKRGYFAQVSEEAERTLEGGAKNATT